MGKGAEMIKVTKTEYGIVYATTGRPGSGGTSSTNPMQKKEWVGLTDDEIKEVSFLGIYEKPLIAFARGVEAKLKEKNAT